MILQYDINAIRTRWSRRWIGAIKDCEFQGLRELLFAEDFNAIENFGNVTFYKQENYKNNHLIARYKN